MIGPCSVYFRLIGFLAISLSQRSVLNPYPAVKARNLIGRHSRRAFPLTLDASPVNPV